MLHSFTCWIQASYALPASAESKLPAFFAFFASAGRPSGPIIHEAVFAKYFGFSGQGPTISAGTGASFPFSAPLWRGAGVVGP